MQPVEWRLEQQRHVRGFLEQGVGSFEDLEFLTLLLGYIGPTVVIATEHCRSLAAVVFSGMQRQRRQKSCACQSGTILPQLALEPIILFHIHFARSAPP